MIITTTENYGLNYEVIGLVKASICLSCNVVQDTAATLKNLMGGEISNYTNALDSASDQIIERVSAKAKEKGADMVIGFRIQAANITTGAVDLIGYGTAIKTLVPKKCEA